MGSIIAAALYAVKLSDGTHPSRYRQRMRAGAAQI